MVANNCWFGELFGVDGAIRPVALERKASARYRFLTLFRRYGGLFCAGTSVPRPATKDRFRDARRAKALAKASGDE